MDRLKGLVITGIALSAALVGGAALAARATEVEIGYFDEYGNLNGSITYPCGGGRYIEGELVGTPRVIYQVSCDEPNGPGTPLPWPCIPPQCHGALYEVPLGLPQTLIATREAAVGPAVTRTLG